jgi:hypothetical protein
MFSSRLVAILSDLFLAASSAWSAAVPSAISISLPILFPSPGVTVRYGGGCRSRIADTSSGRPACQAILLHLPGDLLRSSDIVADVS